MKIGFIGVGLMGGPMAHNLLKAGYELKVFDLVPALLKPLIQDGAIAVDNARLAIEGVDCLITMLPASEHVLSLYLDEEALLEHIDPKTLVIDCSTIAPDVTKIVAGAAAKQGITMLDAPVSGGTKGAKDGTLTFIVGGSAAGFEAAQPVLSAMGKNILHAGDHGAGQMAKICNNMLLAIHMAGTAEAIQLGVNNGLDPKVLSDIMVQSSGRNWSLELYNPYPGVMEAVPASKAYQGGFKVNLMVKDLGLSQQAALLSCSSTPLGALARNLFNLHAAQGSEKLDFSSIQQFYKPK
ncbi:3-hydroxyisobutyrate dehydrogenase [Endozoicomonas sp. SM1973]|uniref:3-hydroxyisobutyrate dehydrogenase n=1 Tax=Spartinivicinus marinus TaxID=2994442 RepID=A0A853HVI2_9GAMM|nr:3-hydroxyisobutyrate dehydrogenase [Spartinivicinus marinus]MCX4025508.1 3-hydroxyisobutyrate dehydrogenase [Spartinivicinus marinus]NYZ65263.1 3-hydroxyisobutyrate dehydrogenase [Spartinivicinus marinus]